MEWFVIVINILGPGRINLSLSSLLSHPHLSSSMADKLKVHFLILCIIALFTPGRTLRNLSSSSFRFLAHYLVQEGGVVGCCRFCFSKERSVQFFFAPVLSSCLSVIMHFHGSTDFCLERLNPFSSSSKHR